MCVRVCVCVRACVTQAPGCVLCCVVFRTHENDPKCNDQSSLLRCETGFSARPASLGESKDMPRNATIRRLTNPLIPAKYSLHVAPVIEDDFRTYKTLF